jgi:hypothetical protein
VSAGEGDGVGNAFTSRGLFFLSQPSSAREETPFQKCEICLPWHVTVIIIMEFVIVRYVHSTGMPSAFGPSLKEKEAAISLARTHSEEFPDDWIRVETSTEVVATFFKGKAVSLYLGADRGA